MRWSDIWGQGRAGLSVPRSPCRIRHELRSLVKEAGFSRVHLRITTNLLRFPSLERYVPGYLAATPIAARLSTIDDRGRAALISDVANALQSFVDDDGLAAPIENHVVVAYK